MAQRTTERSGERGAQAGAETAAAQTGSESMATQSGSESAATQSSDTGMQRRGGGAIGAGPFSLIDWMLDRLQRDFFGSPPAGAGGMQGLSQGVGTTRIPRLNVSETDEEFVITAEVPGVDPNDVQIEIEDDVLTLRAEAREVREEDDGQVISYTRFFTQIPVPDGIDVSSITAGSKNGMVRLRFPKREQQRSVRRIPVSGADGGEASGQQQRAA